MESDRTRIWEDDTRMSVLFSPLRERNLNPSSWNQKVEFWMQMISSECVKCGRVIVDTKSLTMLFQRKGKYPQCLENVVKEMLSQGKLRRFCEADVLATEKELLDKRKGWISWGYDRLLKSPIKWGWNAVKGENPEDIQYIVIEVAELLSQKILQNHQQEVHFDITDSVVSYTELQEKYTTLVQTETDFSVLIQQLVIQKKAVVLWDNSELLVKFCTKTEGSLKPFSDQDLQIHRMKSTTSLLVSQISKLESEKARFRKEALAFKKQNQQQQALRSLRQSKRVDTRIQQLTRSLDMLDDIICRIQHAASDEMVMKALESGATALKGLTKTINIDKVTDIMDNVKEAIEDQEDIQSEICSVSQLISEGSDEDLDQELDELTKQKGSPTTDRSTRDMTNSETELSGIINQRNTPTKQNVSQRENYREISDTSAGGASALFESSLDDLQDISDSSVTQAPEVNKSDLRSDTDELTDLLSDLHLPDVPTFSPSKDSEDHSNKVKGKNTKSGKVAELSS